MHRVWIVEAGDDYEYPFIVEVFKRQRDAEARRKELAALPPDYPSRFRKTKYQYVDVTLHEVK